MRILPSLRLALTIAVVVYLCACVALFVFQRSFIYFLQPGKPVDPITLPVADAHVVASTHMKETPKALIYFGGNAEDVALNLPDLIAAFPNRAIYLLHYRGYGASSGKPSEKALFQDALALFDEVHPRHAQITVMGRSLGSGVAMYVAAHRPIERLFLITPFDSLAAVAAEHYPMFPVRWLLRDKFESLKYAPQVTAPTLILAAQNNEVVPSANTEALKLYFKPNLVSYHVIPNATHNMIAESAVYWQWVAESR